ncbi:MAG: histidine--tRNA ligase [Candidatus Woesearchaeota archaeon]|nr:histidine--tRNA ligase [Candidatus Woesearchaeota archaeon]
MKIEKVRGTRDFYPEEKRIQNFIFGVWKEVAERYGYEEVDGPLIEPIELWQEKSGEEIGRQMYTLTDQSERKLAVRPEMTPTVARMVSQKQKELPKPIKWYSIQRFWRYEKPQSGRLREFWQINLDVLGTEEISADSEVAATAVEIMLKFGLSEKDFYVRINNRKLMKSLLSSIGIPDEKIKMLCRLIDKRDKMPEKEFSAMLSESGLSTKQLSLLMKILDSPDYFEKIDEKSLDSEGKQGMSELKQMLSYLSAFGFLKYCRVDLSLMRGLDYYTANVFEVFDCEKEFRAIAGGGRYDNLVSLFGGEKCPGVGYAMGDVVLGLFLEKKNMIPKLSKNLDFFVASTSESLNPKAVEIAQILRKKYSCETDLMGRNFSKQMKYADSIGAKNLIVIGEDEIKSGKLRIKNMETGKETAVSISEIGKI